MNFKFSQFNTVIHYDNKFIYNNSYTKKYLLLEPLLMDLITAVQTEGNIYELKKVHPELFDELINDGFIINETDDEIEKVKQLIKKIDDNDEQYYLIINPTLNCNFNCWYCYETHIKTSKINRININKILEFVKNIFANKKEIKKLTVSFFGGEPLLYFDNTVVPIINEINKIVKENNSTLYIGFTSNGLLINEEKLFFLKQYNLTGFQISFDGHRELHNMTRYVSQSRGSYDEIINNVKFLVRNNIAVTFRINYTSKNLDTLENILLDLEDLSIEERKKIYLSMNKVWQEQAGYLDEKVSYFTNKAKLFGISLFEPIYSDRVLHSCYADKRNEAVINYNGDVFKCNARDFKTENREGFLNDKGEVVWTKNIERRFEIKLKNKPCLQCSILPMCGGGCSQVALEHFEANQEFCVNDYDENKKKDIILNMFLIENKLDV